MATRPVLLLPSKRYVTPALARLQATAGVRDFALEQRLQRAYRRLLREDLARLLAQLYPDLPMPGQVNPFAHDAYKQLAQDCFPKHFARQQKDRGRVQVQAEERIEEEIPEIISKLPLAELQQVAALVEAEDLLGVIRLVWYVLRPVVWTFTPPERLPVDEAHCRVAGLGKPAAPPASPPPGAAEPPPPNAPAALPPKPKFTKPQPPPISAHYVRVKRAQERRRLKRKRR